MQILKATLSFIFKHAFFSLYLSLWAARSLTNQELNVLEIFSGPKLFVLTRKKNLLEFGLSS